MRVDENRDVSPIESKPVLTERRVLMWLALLCLVFGLGFLDRGFAGWRNDARNFPNAIGRYPMAEELTAAQRAQLFEPAVTKAMMECGLALLVLSVGLFSVAPFKMSRERHDAAVGTPPSSRYSALS